MSCRVNLGLRPMQPTHVKGNKQSVYYFIVKYTQLQPTVNIVLNIRNIKTETLKTFALTWFFNFNNLFLDKGCGHRLTLTKKNEISINLFQVCYQSLSIILFCSRLVKSHTPQRFVLRHCLKNLTMGNPVNHSEHLFCAG